MELIKQLTAALQRADDFIEGFRDDEAQEDMSFAEDVTKALEAGNAFLADPPAPKVILNISGGNLQGVTADGPIDVKVLDYDNLEAGDHVEFDELGYTTDECAGIVFTEEEERMRQEWNAALAKLLAEIE